MRDFCYITKAKQGGIYLEGSYSPEFIALIKEHVPAEHRSWDDDPRRWWVSERYASQAARDARACYAQVIET